MLETFTLNLEFLSIIFNLDIISILNNMSHILTGIENDSYNYISGTLDWK